jgi:branched-chain amino acid transport system ATP-binding protein
MLEVQDLSVRYGPLEAVRGAHFAVERGHIVALVGANGAGKSSMLKAIMGMAGAARGTIRLDGKDITRAGIAARVAAGLALSPEGRRLFGRMSVLDNLLAGAHAVRGGERTRRRLEEVYALFPRVRERRHQLAGSLSGGEQQMVAIGRALMAQPRLLMLDEPSLGIAPKIVAEIAGAIQRINAETGLSIILVEQNARLALRLAHQAYALEHGEIVRAGKGSDLLVDPFIQQAYLGM